MTEDVLAQNELSKKEERIIRISELTGRSQSEIRERIAFAYKQGIESYIYEKYCMYDLTDEEIVEFGELRKKREIREREIDDICVKQIAKSNGRTIKEAYKLADEMKEASGLTLPQMFSHTHALDKATLSPDETLVLEKKDIGVKTQRYIQQIMDQTGWSKGYTYLQGARAYELSGASFEDFAANRFWQVPQEKWGDYITLHVWNRFKYSFNDIYVARKNGNDKVQFNTICDSFIKRKWFASYNLTEADFLEKTKGLHALIVKPVNSTMGKGVYKLESENGRFTSEDYQQIMQSGECIIEECIVQNKEVAAFSDGSVNTVRVATLNKGGDVHFLYSFFRVGGTGSVVDNFHAGGVAVAVDVETGVLEDVGRNELCEDFLVSPATNKPFANFVIPHWDKVRTLCEQVALLFPEVPLMGWDIAILDDGVDLIEGNPGTSYVIRQMLTKPGEDGLMSEVIDPYFEGWPSIDKLTNKQTKNDRILLISEQTGKSVEEVKKRVSFAWKYGINSYYFERKSMIDLNDEEIIEFADLLKKKKVRKREIEELSVKQLATSKGCSFEEADELAKEAKERCDTSLTIVLQQGFTLVDEKGSYKKFANKLQQHTHINAAKYAEQLQQIMDQTGWSKGYTHLQCARAYELSGASCEDFLTYKFWTIPEEKWHEYVTLGAWTRFRVSFNVDAHVAYTKGNNKARFNEQCAPLIKRKWFESQGLTLQEFLEKTDGLDALIVKPNTSTQGKGIFKLEAQDGHYTEADYQVIKQSGDCIVEEFIKQHEQIAAFQPSSVNTVRVATLLKDGEVHFLYTTFRVGGEGSVVDNFHAGGMSVLLNSETGALESKAIDGKGNFHESSVTGKSFVGFTIPHWDKIRALCEQAAHLMADVPLMGWDIAILDDGVDLIEGNPGTGYNGIQCTAAAVKGGLMSEVVDPYFEGWPSYEKIESLLEKPMQKDDGQTAQKDKAKKNTTFNRVKRKVKRAIKSL